MTDTIIESTSTADTIGTVVVAGAGIHAIEAVTIRIFICQCQTCAVINFANIDYWKDFEKTRVFIS